MKGVLNQSFIYILIILQFSKAAPLDNNALPALIRTTESTARPETFASTERQQLYHLDIKASDQTWNQEIDGDITFKKDSESGSPRFVINTDNEFKDDGSFTYSKTYNDGTREDRKGYFKKVNGVEVYTIEGEYSRVLPCGHLFFVKFISNDAGYTVQTRKETKLDVRLG